MTDMNRTIAITASLLAGLLSAPAVTQSAAAAEACTAPAPADAQARPTVEADRLAIHEQLEVWRTASSRAAAKRHFPELEQLYAGGSALRALYRQRGFKGFDVSWMAIDRIQVSGNEALSMTTVLREGDGGYRVLHTWRKDTNGWRIKTEAALSPKDALTH